MRKRGLSMENIVPTVYAWVKRYEENGIKGLETRPGQGRKPIMDCSDEEAVDALQHPSLMNLKIKTHSVICDSKAITNILKKNLMHKKCTE